MILRHIIFKECFSFTVLICNLGVLLHFTSYTMKNFSLASILLLLHIITFPFQGSTQNISGIINTYTPVVSVACNTVTVASVTGFAVGDKVFIIQMKGASIDVTNTPSFGNILNYNEVGNHEYAFVASISGLTIQLTFPLLNNYDPSGLVQLIKVPVYSSPVVTGTLTAQPWNGSTGGILVFEATTSVTLSANIDVSGLGFRGGTDCLNPNGSCAGFGTNLNYAYDIATGLGAEKGEGIVILPVAQQGGRGAAANGGGGGNKHNSGGAGGSNFSKGGRGGNEFGSCGSSPLGGEGGFALDYSSGRLFIGGGGGCSDNNNMVGTTGSNGGGMVIIKSPEINSTGQTISANGVNVPFIVNFIGDGAGGAGAGGTIVLEVNTFTGPLNLQANGGSGGDQISTYPSCFGPGGGGGTGVVLISGIGLPSTVNYETFPGRSGQNIEPTSPCFGSNYGALPGDSANALIPNFTILSNTTFTDSIQVMVNPIHCTGTAALELLNVIAGSSIIWSTGDTLPTLIVNTEGVYSVVVTTGASCVWSDTLNVTLDPLPTISISVSDDTICLGETVYLSFFSSLSGMLSSTEWNYSGLTSPNADLTDAPVVNTWYILTAIDSNGCETSDSMFVLVGDQPVASFDFDAQGCAPFEVEFFTNDSSGDTYTWTTGYNGIELVGNPVSFIYPTAGSYDVGLIVSNIYCSDTLSVPGVIVVYPPSDASFEYSLNTGNIFEVAFNPINTMNNNSYEWLFGDGTTTTIIAPIHAFPFGGLDSSEVCLFTNNTGNCRDTFCLWVDYFNLSTIYFPNSFTPNNDGLNDVFEVYGVNIANARLEIYNRWGERIVSTSGNILKWDGKDNKGLVKTDVYVVRVIFDNMITGLTEEKTGHLTLLK